LIAFAVVAAVASNFLRRQAGIRATGSGPVQTRMVSLLTPNPKRKWGKAADAEESKSIDW